MLQALTINQPYASVGQGWGFCVSRKFIVFIWPMHRKTSIFLQ